MRGFIYLWVNLVNQKMYVGKCWKKRPEQCIGSGRHFKHALAHHGIANFERFIIEWCDSKEELAAREEWWLAAFDAAHDPRFYNISPRALGGHHGADYRGDKNPMWGRKHPNHCPNFGAHNGMYGTSRTFGTNPNARPFLLTAPDGVSHRTECLKAFVWEHFEEPKRKAYRAFVEKVARRAAGAATRGCIKGWTIEHDGI